ncbi:MAG: hypothetical protein OHK0017_11710 [Patescibacteria group bacterium]
MISEIHLQNFKRVKDQVQILGLTGVNYFVGDNGCGKSSVLSSIQYFALFQERKGIRNFNDYCLKIDFQSLKEINYRDLSDLMYPHGYIEMCLKDQGKDFEMGRIEPMLVYNDGHHLADMSMGSYDRFRQKINSQKMVNLSELNDLASNDDWLGSDSQVEKVARFVRHLFSHEQGETSASEPAGQTIFENLANQLLYLVSFLEVNTIMLEEPENHLNPALQKKIPMLLDFFRREFGVQFFVATHSPFIISASGKLTEQERDSAESNGKLDSFVPSQKVYFMKNGQISSKHGVIEKYASGKSKGSFGYWGSKCNMVAAKMLGAGITDLINPQRFIPNGAQTKLILCEGQGNDEDARIYNIIFAKREPRVLFVSARGSSQLFTSFQILNEIKKGLSANFQLSMLRDRDHEFLTEADIVKYEKLNPGVKVLRRRAIECYLFDSEVVEKFVHHHGGRINQSILEDLEILQSKIQIEAERGVLGNDYKYLLKQKFYELIDGQPIDMNGKDDLGMELAKHIRPESKVYRELEKIIFESNHHSFRRA